jgi:hypothetical protein
MPYLDHWTQPDPARGGLSLAQIDDEQALIARLEIFFQSERKQAVVYFDRAQSGSADYRSAFLHAHFVRPPAIADTAILQHLRKLGGEARNWTVVSSDGNVRNGAKKAGARREQRSLRQAAGKFMLPALQQPGNLKKAMTSPAGWKSTTKTLKSIHLC